MSESRDQASASAAAVTEPRGGGRWGLPLLWMAALGVTLALGAANLFLGELNQDEGWYLYAARLVSQGQKPYVDFASTQGPVMPYVYALAQPLVDQGGLAGGRLFTALLGFLCSLGAAALAARLAPPDRRKAAAFVAFALVAVNVYQSYFFAIVKTYALTGLFLVSGFVALTFADRKRGWAAALLSGVLLSLAAATRISAVMVLPVVFVALLLPGVRFGDSPVQRRGFLPAAAFAAGAALTLGLVFLPSWLRAPEGVRFALFEYHAGRDPGGLASILAHKAGFVSRVAQAYLVAFSVLLVAVAIRLRGAGSGAQEREGASLPVLWTSVLAVTAIHFFAGFPYDDYQVMIYPVFVAAVAVALVRWVAQARELWAMAVLLLLCVAAAFSSPVNQNWFVGQRDRIWWPVKKQFPLAALREAAAQVRSMSKPGDVLLTQDAYLAVEAGRRLPRGMELGPFCYFPDWTREKATRIHVLNRDMMRELLEKSDAPVAAFSGYGLAIRAPEVIQLPGKEQQALWAIVEERYQVEKTIGAFGQAETPLKILGRKAGAE